MKTSNILWGIILVVIGVIFGLNALEITNINIFFDGFWTLFIIIPCFIGLFKEKDKKGNLIGIFIGLFLLLSCQNIVDFDLLLKLLVPVVLVIIGLSIIFNDKIKKEIKSKSKEIDKEYFATFAGQNLTFKDDEFESSTLNAVFGGIKCDLKDADIKNETIINAFAIFGGITIYVPEDVNVKICSTPIFGGVSDERKNKKEKYEKTLYINATCIFGGVDIK